MADTRGVNIADPREARLHSAVLLQGLAGGGEEHGMFIVGKKEDHLQFSSQWGISQNLLQTNQSIEVKQSVILLKCWSRSRKSFTQQHCVHVRLQKGYD